MNNTSLNLYEIRKELFSGKTIYDLPLKVTYYARVSTDKYEQLSSLGNQIEYYEDTIKSCKNWTYVPGYVDEGISGTSTQKRNRFNSMIKDSHMNKFNLVLTKEISRFSRNTLDSIKYTQELLSNNIGVYFECDNINTFMPDSELRLTIMASMAQEEVRKLSERVKFGFQRSIKKGRVLGNNSIWGYKKDDCKLIIIPEEAQLIKKIFDMYVHDHIGMKSIGKELSKLGYKSRRNTDFSSSSIKGILTNPKYKGYYCGNKTKVVDYRLKKVVSVVKDDWIYYKDEERVPPIVTEEIWNEAQKILLSKSNKIRCNKEVFTNRYPFSTKIICSQHNAFYRRKINTSNGKVKKKKVVWICSEYINHGLSACDSPLIDEKDLKHITITLIKSSINNKGNIVNDLVNMYSKYIKLNDVNKSLETKKCYIENLSNKKNILLELRLNKQISDIEFNDKNKEYTKELSKTNIEINSIISENNNVISKNFINKLKKNIIDIMNFNDETSDELIYSLLDKIYVNKTKTSRYKVNLDVYIKYLKRHFCIDYTYDKSRCRK